MPDIQRLIDTMRNQNAITRIARNRAAQFGTRTQRFIGAELLPAEDVQENAYTDDTVRYRTVIANAGPRYGPVVLKGSVISGTVKVELFDIDIGSELNSRDYDALLRYLNSNASMEAMASLTNFLNTTVNLSLEMTREVYRWAAIEKASITRRGANGYRETIPYSNPAGFRAVAAAAWSTDATDIMADISNRVQLMKDNGYTVSRIFSTQNVVSIMAGNDTMRTRVGHVKVNVTTGAFTTSAGRPSKAALDAAFSDEGLPPIELIDGIYRTQSGTGRYISTDVMIIVAATGRDVSFELGDTQGTVELLPDTLGYYAVGRAAGQATPGRVLQLKFNDDDKPLVQGKGWETGGPVITEPMGITTITGIA